MIELKIKLFINFEIFNKSILIIKIEIINRILINQHLITPESI